MKCLLTITLILANIFFLSATNNINIEELMPEKLIVVANPTARNIEIIKFLTENRIFDVNTSETGFVGVYHKGQSYDFAQSRRFIEENGIDWITLKEIEGELTPENVYQTNPCTPVFRDLFNRSVGVLFFGGPDIQPELYGEENLYSEVTDPVRHLFEVSFAFHLTGGSRNADFVPFLDDRPDYLVTGFCLGMQTMNVAAGGTLWQDIPAQLYNKFTPEETVKIDRENLHRNYWQLMNDDELLMTINLHWVQFTDHPFFGSRVKVRKSTRPRAYSSHHQSVKDMGPGYEVTALSPDKKVIEGFAHNRFPNVFAVQFHPEVPALYEDRNLRKFEPTDKPRTMHRIIGIKGVLFHLNYWKFISSIVNGL